MSSIRRYLSSPEAAFPLAMGSVALFLFGSGAVIMHGLDQIYVGDTKPTAVCLAKKVGAPSYARRDFATLYNAGYDIWRDNDFRSPITIKFRPTEVSGVTVGYSLEISEDSIALPLTRAHAEGCLRENLPDGQTIVHENPTKPGLIQVYFTKYLPKANAA